MRRLLAASLCILLLAAVTAGCKEVKLGARCRSAEAAGSGAWVVTCRNGRWTRAMTKADAAKIVVALLQARTTTTTMPPPPPPPPPTPRPLEVFGQGEYEVGTGWGQVQPGLYVTTDGYSACEWARFDAQENVLGAGRTVPGVDFLQVNAGDAWVASAGSCTWTPAPPTAVVTGLNGTKRLGVEVQGGWYRVERCTIQGLRALDGSPGSLVSSHGAWGPDIVHVDPGLVAIELQGCDEWTPLATLPSDFVTLVRFNHDGRTFGSTWSPLDRFWSTTWTPGTDGGSGRFELESTYAGLSMWLEAAAGEQLHPGTFAVLETFYPTAGLVGMRPGGIPKPCDYPYNEIEIESVVSDGTGAVTSVEATIRTTCAGELHQIIRIEV